MRVFAIKNESYNSLDVAYLLYFEKKKKFYIELLDNANEWNTPILLSSFAKRGIKSIDSKWSKIWVQQRIVPTDRQNISKIIKDNKLSTYDEFKLLLITDGKCSQDDCYIKEINFEDLPKSIIKRYDYRVLDFSILSNNRLLIFFNNGKTKICDIYKIISFDSKLYKYLKSNPDEFSNLSILVGGYGIGLDENMYITCIELYDSGINLNISREDINIYVSKNVVNTAEACDILNCSRQYIEQLINNNKLSPIKVTEKGKLFLKSEVEKIGW